MTPAIGQMIQVMCQLMVKKLQIMSRNGYAEIRSTYLEWKGQFGDD